MDKGVDKYKGKSLSEIDINPQEEMVEEDSDNDDITPDDREYLKADIKSNFCSLKFYITIS